MSKTEKAPPHKAFRLGAAIALLTAVNAVYFCSYFQRVGIPGTIFNELQADFQTSASGVTMLGAIFLYIYAFMQLPAGLLTDRFGAMRVFSTGAILLNSGAFLFPMAHNLFLLYAARALVGLGSGLIFASIVKLLTSVFPERMFAILLGVSLSVGYCGGLAGTLPFQWGASLWGWRNFLFAMAVAGTLALSTAIFLYTRLRGMRTANDLKMPAEKTKIWTILKNPRIRTVFFVHATNFSIYFFLQAVMGKKILQDCFGVSSGKGSFFTFLMMFTTIICLTCSGILSHALGNRRAPVLQLATLAVLAGAGLLLLGIIHELPLAIILLSYCLLAMSSLGSPMGNTLMKELNPTDVVGTSIGIINTFCYLSVAIFTSFSGWLIDQFKSGAVIKANAVVYPQRAYLTIVAVCAGFMVASFVVSFFLPETDGRHPEFTEALRE